MRREDTILNKDYGSEGTAGYWLAWGKEIGQMTTEWILNYGGKLC